MYIGKKVVDTREGIFKRVFYCRIPYKASRSIEHIRMFGMSYTGDKEIDKDLHNQTVERYMTINDMTDVYKEGYEIGIMEPKDTKIIYELIMDHLRAWEEDIKYEFTADFAPLDDLVLLDKLAAEVYKHSKFVGIDIVEDTGFGDFFGLHGGTFIPVTREQSLIPTDMKDHFFDGPRDKHGLRERISMETEFRPRRTGRG